ncbi:MAG: SBBP repeat-containing protein, partial [Acidobacteriota bacterium]
MKQAYGRLPMSFEANQGQADTAVKFIARGHGYQVFLTADEAVLVLQNQAPDSKAAGGGQDIESHKLPEIKSSALRFKMPQAQPDALITPSNLLPGKTNYLVGNDPQQWHTEIPNYSRVEYREVYSGIGLAYYGTQRALEYDFVIAPGADPSQITMTVEGAEKIEQDANGDLVLHVAGQRVYHRSPVSYQTIAGQRRAVGSRYVLKGGNQIGFEVAGYDAKQTLVIDPVIDFSTFFGGIGSDEGLAIAVDAAGAAYVTGTTYSNNFNTFAPLQTINRGGKYDTFVTKINPAGSAIVYSTYLGGGAEDSGHGIAVDSSGNAFVVGITNSADFNTRNAMQASIGGVADDAFISKLNADGTDLLFSTYLGGNAADQAFAVAVNASGDAYVTGSTASSNFPLKGALQNVNRGNTDVFVTKIMGNGSQLIYSTFLGGSQFDEAYAIALDPGGNAFVAGGTTSFDFNTANPFQPNNAGGGFDAFLARINSQGSQLAYSTYFGGSAVDVAYGVTVDGNNNGYITGHTFSTDFPTQSPLQASNGGNADAFVARFNVNGSGLIYSTYLGGTGGDFGRGIGVDANAQAYVTGRTVSTDFNTRNPLQSANRGNFDVFVSKLSINGGQLVYSTYLGGASDDLGFGIALDSSGNAYVTGDTRSTDFNTKNPLQAANRGGLDAFVTKINANGADMAYSTYLGGSGEDIASSIALDTAGNAYITGYTSSNDYPAVGAIQAVSKGGLEVFVTKIFADASSIAFNTYFGGNGSDTGNSIAVDSSGNAYVTGATTSTNFPTRNPIQAVNRGSLDGFVAKFNATGANVIYSTYLGGTFGDGGRGIALDQAGNAFIVGSTFSDDFPVLSAFQPVNRGQGDAFITRINSSGTALTYSSFLGGAGTDEAAGIAVDTAGNAYIVGNTGSGDFNTRNPLQTTNRGQQDAFVTKVNAGGASLAFSTYLGGQRADLGNSIALDQSNNVYITGSTASLNFPVQAPLQATYGGGDQDAFVTKINAAGTALAYSTYLGGSMVEVGNAIAVDPFGNAYVTGLTASLNFPLRNPIQANNRGGNEAFISKLNPQGSGFVYSTYLGGSNSDQGSGLAVNASGTAYVTGATASPDFNIQFPLVAYGGGTDVFVAKIISEASLSLSPSPLELQQGSSSTMTVTISAAQTQAATVTLTSSNGALASVPATVTIPANATSADFTVTGAGVGNGVIITAALPQAQGGATATATVNVITSNRFIAAAPATAAAGGLVTVPISLVSQGNENRLSFSLSLDTAIFPTQPQFTLGADAASAGATLTTVPSTPPQGRYGIVITLPAGQKFDAGTRQILVLTAFVQSGITTTTTTISFGDSPTVRRVQDVNGQTLSTNYASSTVTIASGYEGDVSPRPNGSSGTVTIADWVQTGRFAAGFDVAAVGSEYQRADTAPRATSGNGAITISDWVQTGRYASGLDPVVPAGGPVGPSFAASPGVSFTEPNEAQQTRIARITSVATQRGQQFTTFVELDAQGNENAFGFSITFDAAQLNFASASAGADAANSTINVNTMQAAQGRIGIAMALATSSSLAAGNNRKLVALTFNAPANGTANSIQIGFGDQPIPREVVNVNADVLTVTWNAGTVNIARSIASVSAASFAGGDLAPEQIIAAFGTGLATTTQVATTVPLPTVIGGTTVRVRDNNGVGRLAPLFFVAPTQVNYLIPPGTALGAATVTITSGDGATSVGTVNITSVSPGLFTANASGTGVAAATVLRIKADNSQSYEAVGQFNPSTGAFTAIPIDLGPADEQIFLLLFGTGFRGNGGLPNV